MCLSQHSHIQTLAGVLLSARKPQSRAASVLLSTSLCGLSGLLRQTSKACTGGLQCSEHLELSQAEKSFADKVPSTRA